MCQESQEVLTRFLLQTSHATSAYFSAYCTFFHKNICLDHKKALPLQGKNADNRKNTL